MASNRSKFLIPDAVTTPLRLPSGRGYLFRVALWAASLMLVIYAVLGRELIPAYGEFLVMNAELQANPTEQPDPEELAAAFDMFEGMGLQILGFILALWGVFIAAETAFHKNIFHGVDMGVFPLRFGRDELRVLVAQICVFFAVFAVMIVGFIGLIIIAILSIALMAASKALGAVIAIVSLIAMFLWVAALIIVAARLAPAAAMSVRDGRQYTFDGWAVVKGRTWPMVGSYILIYILGYIGISAVLFLGLNIAFGSGDVWKLFMGFPVEDPATALRLAGEAIQNTSVKMLTALTLAVYTFGTLVFQSFMWGVGNYAAQLDTRDGG